MITNLNCDRSETPTSVLIAMKAVVIACKLMTEDSEVFENSESCELTDNERSQIYDIKSLLSNALTRQIAVAKNLATNYKMSTVGMLEDCTAELSETIVALLHLFQRHTGLSNSESDLASSGLQSRSQSNMEIPSGADQSNSSSNNANPNTRSDDPLGRRPSNEKHNYNPSLQRSLSRKEDSSSSGRRDGSPGRSLTKDRTLSIDELKVTNTKVSRCGKNI